MQAQNLTVKITKTDSTSSTEIGKNSLEEAIGATPLGDVAKLEISAGDFVTADWNWLKDKSSNLTALTHFTITNSADSVADIPGILWPSFYFGRQIKEVSVAKVKSIGNHAFYGCIALTTASFPLVTSIGQGVFSGCIALSNLMLGVIPPTNIGTDAFAFCPEDRFLVPVNADGVPLTGPDLTTALEAYKNIDDGNTNDNLWYGWVAEPTYLITVNPASNGKVGAPQYAPANAPVRLTPTPDVGYMLQDLTCDKQGGGEIDIDMSNHTFTMPAEGVTVSATFVPNVLQVFVNNESTVRTGTSLESALSGVTLGEITSLEITGGSFLAADWSWLRAKRADLTALTDFTITDGASTVTDIPNTEWSSFHFGEQIKKVSVAKVANIGDRTFHGCTALTTVSFPQAKSISTYAFRDCIALTSTSFPHLTTIGIGAFKGCTALSRASFPQVTNIGAQAFEDCIALSATNFPLVKSIGNSVFNNCTALSNLMLGATPPSVGIFVFNDCPANRFLILVDASGTPLTDEALINALTLYKNVDDGGIGDDFWYGWKLGETLYPITINPTSNGTVGAPYYAPANATVALTITIEEGYLFQDLSYTKQSGGGAIAIDTSSCTFIMPDDGVTVSATFVENVLQVSVNESIIRTGNTLANALNENTLGDITSLTITGGTFLAADWSWLKAKRADLSALTHFTITDSTGNVADMPNTVWEDPYFGKQITELNVAKVATIGNYAFQGCAALTTANFPQATSIGIGAFRGCAALTTASFPMATSIGGHTFYGCTALSNLRLGATPPSILAAYAFSNCPDTRFLIPVDADGVPLTGQNLTNALTLYKNVDDGNTNDSLWYGWVAEPTYPITITPASNGTVSAPQYASADATVTLIVTPDVSYLLQNLSYTKQSGGEAIAIDISSCTFTMPAEGVTVSATFALNELQVFVNNESTVRTGISLENALDGVTLGEITSLTIMGGTFFEADWSWLKAKRTDLSALTYFTITDSTSSVANIPYTEYGNPYFGKKIKELSVAKIASIGMHAFQGCTALTTASFPMATSIGGHTFRGCTALSTVSFPQATDIDGRAFLNCTALSSVNFPLAMSIGFEAFSGCTSLSATKFPQVTSIDSYAFLDCTTLNNLMLGATPPVVIETNAFEGCPDNRFLTPINASGTPLTGQDLINALASYKNIDDGNTNDSLWYGWIIEPPHPIVINPSSYGTVSSIYPCAPAGITVALIVTPNTGYILQSLSYTKKSGGEAIAIDTSSCTFIMPDDGITIKATFVPNLLVTVNGSINKSGSSLGDALSGVALNEITSLTITGGPFYISNWYWLQDNRNNLNALTHFTITDGVVSIADVPTVGGWEQMSIFGKQIIKLCVAKVAGIGGYAFQGCSALNTVYFPQVTSIGGYAFENCTALANAGFPLATNIGEGAFFSCTTLINLMLGATPPTSVGTNAFNGCPDTRYLIPVNADGMPLTGQDLTNALASYKNVDDGNTGDSLWYGWKLGETLFPVEINYIGNGTVTGSYRYAPAGATVKLSIIPEAGYMLQSISCVKSGGYEVDIDTSSYTFSMPAERVTVSASFEPNVLHLTVNDSIIKTGTSLENALEGVEPGDITSLTITEGAFFATDWNWLKDNRTALAALTYFTITDGVTSVADIPITQWGTPYFSNHLKELSVAKIAKIGNYAFSGRPLTTASFPQVTVIGDGAFRDCTALSTTGFPKVTSIGWGAFYDCTALNTADFPQVTNIGDYAFTHCNTLNIAVFPQVTSIGNNAFFSCRVLTNLMPGATPPVSVGTDVFAYCPTNRFLIPVDESGIPLTGTNLTDALASYKNIDDGDTNDSLWYGWIVEPTLPITTNPTNNGMVVAPRYASAGATVTLVVTPDAGYILQSLICTVQGGEEVPIDMNSYSFTMPNEGVTINAVFVPNLLVTVNGSSNKSGTSLENVLDGVALDKIITLTITGGPFFESDWNWLKNKRTELKALTHFTVTDGLSSVADIPDTEENNPYFGEQIIELSVAKIANIGNFAFHGCTALSAASFPQVTSISRNVFENCTNLRTAGLLQATDIGSSAFFGCTSFSTANFPVITSIGDSAFANCTALTNLMPGATPPESVGTNAFSACPEVRFLIPVNADGMPLTGQELTEALALYKNIDDGDTNDMLWYGWKLGETLYPVTIKPADNGTVIASYSYAPADATVTLGNIPDTGYILQSYSCVKQGGGEVTIDLNSHSFTMPDDSVNVSATFVPNLLVTVNGSNNKSGTSLENALSGITLGEIISLTITGGPFSVSDWSFIKNNRDILTALTHFTITDDIRSVENIPDGGGSIFGEQIIEVSVAKVLSIGNEAFNGCTALTNANFPWVTSIGSGAFYGCAALTTANFPWVTSIGYGAFHGCTTLTTANFPQVTSISSHAFFGCTALTTANFPLATGIGWNAFLGCTALTTASFPQVTSIGQAAFQGCTTLSNLMLGATPPSVADVNVFNNCPDIRFLIPVNAEGVPLTGQDLTDALGTYDADEGQTDDKLWYGWKLEETLYSITINPVDNGTVTSSYRYAPTEATVTLTVSPNTGYRLKEGSLRAYKTGEEGTTVAITDGKFTMPAYGVTVEYEFELIPTQFTITFVIPENGTLSVKQGTTELSSGEKVDENSEITITATPNIDYIIKSLTVNGTAFESGNTHKVVANVEIVAMFTKDTGIDTNVVSSFMLYPNPTNGKVNIKGLQQPANITVYNSIGVAIYTRQLNPAETLDLGHLPGGVYMIRVNNTTTLRVVKQ